MSDIVERLRDWSEAAAEMIERLEAEVKRLQAENERLRAALEGRIQVATDLQMKLAAERAARVAVASPVRREGEL